MTLGNSLQDLAKNVYLMSLDKNIPFIIYFREHDKNKNEFQKLKEI